MTGQNYSASYDLTKKFSYKNKNANNEEIGMKLSTVNWKVLSFSLA
jgi:hypothetical protein